MRNDTAFSVSERMSDARLSVSHRRIVATQSEGNNTWLGYAIAGITLGAAIGNMFMAGKIRNIMKMQIPNPESFREGRKASTRAETHTAEEAAEEATAHQRAYASAQKHNMVPEPILSHLNTLKIPHDGVNESAIKSAYRKAVMQYHPDRMQLKDAELKPVYEAKFKQSTDSYNALIEYYVKQKNG